eukprot:754046-Hanusia_phi.AAC.2
MGPHRDSEFRYIGLGSRRRVGCATRDRARRARHRDWTVVRRPAGRLTGGRRAPAPVTVPCPDI